MSEAEGLVEPYYYDYWGNRVETPESSRRALAQAMGAWGEPAAPVIVVRERQRPKLGDSLRRCSVELEDGTPFEADLAELPRGYHALRTHDGDVAASLIVCPPRCYLSREMRRERMWALSTQLYALTSRRNWGIGDFTDLAALATMAGEAGARAVALNPLHQLHPHNPHSASPYSPSSRLFLNVLYIDVERVPELRESAEASAQIHCVPFEDGLQKMRSEELVDYRSVARAKIAILETLHRAFVDHHVRRNDARARAFKRFVRQGGLAIERLGMYEALAQHFWRRDPTSYGWRQWPAEYRSPSSAAVAKFAREHREQIDFFLYLQWIADAQLREAAAQARRRRVAFYLDLAVGADANGAEVWSDQHAYAADASLGAPADPLNLTGQSWGLAPLCPMALRRLAYRPFVELLRANMRHAAILRVDHVMALQRAFWIPRGAPASSGAYVRYPFDEMLGILALESVRNRCAVVGEDLGTLPEGFRERMQSANALSTRLLYFQRNWSDGSFLPPTEYPRLAAASIGTHDLPTLPGWWTGDRADGEDRARDRMRLVHALKGAGALDAAAARRLRDDAARGGTLAVADELVAAAYRFLGATPCVLVVVAIEELLGEPGGVNVPGTFDEHPNWRRKRSFSLEEIESDGRLMQIGRVLVNR